MMKEEHLIPARTLFGSAVAILTFLAGITLLMITFYMAYQLFLQPPEIMIAEPEKGVDVSAVGPAVTKAMIYLIYKSAMLIFMIVSGSILTQRGIKLYGL